MIYRGSLDFPIFFPLLEPDGRLCDIATIKQYKTTKLNIKYQAYSYFAISNDKCYFTVSTTKIIKESFT